MKLPQHHRASTADFFAKWHGYFAGLAWHQLRNAESEDSPFMKAAFLKSARDYGRYARREYDSWQKAVTNGEMT